MGTVINIANVKIGDNARVLNDAKITNTNAVEIGLHDMEIAGQAKILENLEINSVLQELNEKVCLMDKNSDEYFRIKEILEVKRWNRKKFCKCIAAHISDFSKGIIASIVANYITKL